MPSIDVELFEQVVKRCVSMGRSLKCNFINESQLDMEVRISVNDLLERHGIDCRVEYFEDAEPSDG